MSTVYCVVPVHNRLRAAKQCIELLQRQSYSALQIVIVDHSSDGSHAELARMRRHNVIILRGEPTFWWSAATRFGMEFALKVAGPGDYILLLNDDVRVENDFVQMLVEDSERFAGAVVGALQVEEDTGAVLSRGIAINWLGIYSYPVGYGNRGDIDALPGRGMLLPVSVVRKIGHIHDRWFPQVYGDIEYSARAKDHGFNLVVSERAKVYTSNGPKAWMHGRRGWLERYFSPYTPTNIPQTLLFCSMRGPRWLRLWAVPRFVLTIPFRPLLRRRLGPSSLQGAQK